VAAALRPQSAPRRAPQRAAAGTAEPAAAADDLWELMRVVDLRAHLKRRGLAVSGKKEELVARLRAAGASKSRSALVVPSDDPFRTADPPRERVDKFDDMLREDVQLEGDLQGLTCYVSSTRSASKPAGMARGVVVLAQPTALRESIADSIAATCNAIVVAPVLGAGEANSTVVEACAQWLRSKRDMSNLWTLGVVAFDEEACGAVIESSSDAFDALVFWKAPTEAWTKDAVLSKLGKINRPMLALVFGAGEPSRGEAVALRNALDAREESSDYVVRVVASDIPTEPLREEDDSLLLCTAWLDLYMRTRDRTQGPAAKSLWIDDMMTD